MRQRKTTAAEEPEQEQAQERRELRKTKRRLKSGVALLLPSIISLVVFVGVFSGLSYMLTGDWTWSTLRAAWPALSAGGGSDVDVDVASLPVYTLEELKKYNGDDPSVPLLLSIKHHVFDVSSGRKFYGKGAGYNAFAGTDASRGFFSGCFANERNYDLRGLTKEQEKDIDDWLDFYLKHDTYKLVGRLQVHIDPNDPLPDDTCHQEP